MWSALPAPVRAQQPERRALNKVTNRSRVNPTSSPSLKSVPLLHDSEVTKLLSSPNRAALLRIPYIAVEETNKLNRPPTRAIAAHAARSSRIYQSVRKGSIRMSSANRESTSAHSSMANNGARMAQVDKELPPSPPSRVEKSLNRRSLLDVTDMGSARLATPVMRPSSSNGSDASIKTTASLGSDIGELIEVGTATVVEIKRAKPKLIDIKAPSARARAAFYASKAEASMTDAQSQLPNFNDTSSIAQPSMINKPYASTHVADQSNGSPAPRKDRASRAHLKRGYHALSPDGKRRVAENAAYHTRKQFEETIKAVSAEDLEAMSQALLGEDFESDHEDDQIPSGISDEERRGNEYGRPTIRLAPDIEEILGPLPSKKNGLTYGNANHVAHTSITASSASGNGRMRVSNRIAAVQNSSPYPVRSSSLPNSPNNTSSPAAAPAPRRPFWQRLSQPTASSGAKRKSKNPSDKPGKGPRASTTTVNSVASSNASSTRGLMTNQSTLPKSGTIESFKKAGQGLKDLKSRFFATKPPADGPPEEELTSEIQGYRCMGDHHKEVIKNNRVGSFHNASYSTGNGYSIGIGYSSGNGYSTSGNGYSSGNSYSAANRHSSGTGHSAGNGYSAANRYSIGNGTSKGKNHGTAKKYGSFLEAHSAVFTNSSAIFDHGSSSSMLDAPSMNSHGTSVSNESTGDKVKRDRRYGGRASSKNLATFENSGIEDSIADDGITNEVTTGMGYEIMNGTTSEVRSMTAEAENVFFGVDINNALDEVANGVAQYDDVHGDIFDAYGDIEQAPANPDSTDQPTDEIAPERSFRGQREREEMEEDASEAHAETNVEEKSDDQAAQTAAVHRSVAYDDAVIQMLQRGEDWLRSAIIASKRARDPELRRQLAEEIETIGNAILEARDAQIDSMTASLVSGELAMSVSPPMFNSKWNFEWWYIED